MRKLYSIILVAFVALCSFSCSPKTVVIDDQVPAGNIVFEPRRLWCT